MWLVDLGKYAENTISVAVVIINNLFQRIYSLLLFWSILTAIYWYPYIIYAALSILKNAGKTRSKIVKMWQE